MRSPFSLSFVAAVFLISACNKVFSEFLDCPDCDASFTLTHADLACIAKRIDRLLDRPDPVYFDAANCDRGSGSVNVMSSSLPNLKAPAPSTSPAAKWLQLTKQQLQCLRTKLPALEASKDDPLAVSLSSADCSGIKQ